MYLPLNGDQVALRRSVSQTSGPEFIIPCTYLLTVIRSHYRGQSAKPAVLGSPVHVLTFYQWSGRTTEVSQPSQRSWVHQSTYLPLNSDQVARTTDVSQLNQRSWVHQSTYLPLKSDQVALQRFVSQTSGPGFISPRTYLLTVIRSHYKGLSAKLAVLGSSVHVLTS